MAQKKHDGTITKQIIIFLMALVIISTATIGSISYFMHKNESIQARASEAMHVAISVAHGIDGDRFAQIMQTLEEDDYWQETQDYLGQVASETNAVYLYAIDSNYENGVLYFGEGSTIDEPFVLGDTDEDFEAYADEMYETINTGQPSLTEPYPSGDYGEMVSGFAPIFNRSGQIVGLVGVDFLFEDILAGVNAFGFSLAIIVAAFLLVFCLVSLYVGKKFIGKPLTALDGAARQLARGDMDIRVDTKAKSEIGRLSQSFDHMVEGMKTQIAALEAVSHGDLTIHIEPRGEKDTMGHAIVQILNSLNGMFSEINRSAAQVSSGSSQISDGAQLLAQGAAEQSTAIEELSSSIADMAVLTNQNAATATKAAELAEMIKVDAETGSGQMDRMTQAVKEISDASVSIGKVIKVIDDIAFQTNILALNAAVEAARAGQHGKGFAVVAEEVRSLAAKSAEAARDTGSLIVNSMEKAELGAAIAGETAESLSRIIQGINESALLVNGIAKSFQTQSAAIEQINQGIEQVSQVVQQNSATAQESAAASEEMSGQSGALHELIERFKIKDTAYGQAALSAAPSRKQLAPPRDNNGGNLEKY